MIDIEDAIQHLDWNKQPHGLYDPIAYTLASGGKRLRPRLVMTACRMFGGAEEEALPAALAIEVFHNFTLLHDDVMDKAPVRRGRETVHVKWNDNTAILSGDEMVIEAYHLLSLVPEAKLSRCLKLFNQMNAQICEGQQYDMDFETQPHVSIDEYLHMIRLKTSVLLGCALQLGAVIAGADEALQQALYRYGVNVGIAFQIQDDILDVYGDEKTFGKAIGGDILCNKKTYMLISALEMADEATRREMAKWMTIHEGNDKIAAFTRIYDRLEVRQRCEKAMADYTAHAIAELDSLPQNPSTDELRSLAMRLMQRTQ